jgi:hypothetical protein
MQQAQQPQQAHALGHQPSASSQPPSPLSLSTAPSTSTAAGRGTDSDRRALRNAAPRYVTGCSLLDEPGEAGSPAVDIGWHAECSHRAFLVGRRAGCMSVSCPVSCIPYPVSGVRCRVAVVPARPLAIGPAPTDSVRCAVPAIELGPTPSILRRPTSPRQPATSYQQPLARLPLICGCTPKMPHIVCGQRQGQARRKIQGLNHLNHLNHACLQDKEPSLAVAESGYVERL